MTSKRIILACIFLLNSIFISANTYHTEQDSVFSFKVIACNDTIISLGGVANLSAQISNDTDLDNYFFEWYPIELTKEYENACTSTVPLYENTTFIVKATSVYHNVTDYDTLNIIIDTNNNQDLNKVISSTIAQSNKEQTTIDIKDLVIEDTICNTPKEILINVANLNYIQYSIAKIKATENKAIAENEYYSVINQLSFDKINDTDIIDVYGEFLSTCSNLVLKQEEKDFIIRLNEKKRKDAYKSAFSNLGSVFVPGASPEQMIASLIYTAVSNVFAVMNTRAQLSSELEKELFYLSQEMASEIYAMQTKLFTTTAKVISGEDSKRINENSMNQFILGLNLTSAEEKVIYLNEPQFKKNLSYFPPYWYELGKAYQLTGKYNNAIKCYDIFEQLKKEDVISKDQNYVNLAKNKIQIYLGDKPSDVLSNATKNKDKILECINIINSNTLDSDACAKHTYLAKIYYLIGEKGKCMESINYVTIIGKNEYTGYFEEIMMIKRLLMADDTFNPKTCDYYKQANIVSNIKWSDETIESSLTDPSWWEIFDFPYKSYHDIIIPSNSLYFSIPSDFFDLHPYHNTYFNINNYYYDYQDYFDDNTKSLFIATNDFMLQYIQDHAILSFVFKDTLTSEVTYEYKFMIKKFDNYSHAEKAFKRIDCNINDYNAEIALLFGNEMSLYEYNIEDDNKKREEIRNKLEEKNKKNKESGEAKTKKQLETAICNEISKALHPDISNIQHILETVQSDFYNSTENIMYKPTIAKYNGQYYVIGLIDIVNTYKKEHIELDTKNDFIKSYRY